MQVWTSSLQVVLHSIGNHLFISPVVTMKCNSLREEPNIAHSRFLHYIYRKSYSAAAPLQAERLLVVFWKTASDLWETQRACVESDLTLEEVDHNKKLLNNIYLNHKCRRSVWERVNTHQHVDSRMNLKCYFPKQSCVLPHLSNSKFYSCHLSVLLSCRWIM